MVMLVAIKPHPIYGQGRKAVGDTYELSPRDAAFMVRLGWAKPADAADVASAIGQAAGGTYDRRDLHAAEPSADRPLAALRRNDLVMLAENLGITVQAHDTRAELIDKITDARAAKA
jgi:hypothetical protein